MKKDVIVRDYQVEAIKFLETEHDKLVLAMCPSSGKTETIIHYIDDLYKQDNNVKVLILPHSTNVLLDNFYQRLESRNLDFTYSTDTNTNCNVHVILPQSHSKIKDKYNIVIIDEAHENYLAKTVQNILKRTSPAKQILLTGTPYQFVDKKEFKIHFLALNDLDSSLLPKLRFDIAESDYEWNGNYNNSGEIKSSFIFKKENTDKTLDDTFKFIFDRENQKEVNKTLIVCKSIEQSEFVKSYLDNIDINSEISNSKNDTKSEIVNDFKKNKIKVLIVVNRARLGYDDSDLINLIDISGTLNPNIIYQMFARLLRGDNSQQKYYIRLTSKNDELLNSELSTSLALMLTDKKYIQIFNGKNFKEKDIIIKKDVFINLKKNKNLKNKNKIVSSNKIISETYDIINFYKNVIIETEKNIGLYKFCKVSDVLDELSGFKQYKRHTLESCKESASKYNTRSEWAKNDGAICEYARRKGWHDECCTDMEIKFKTHTLESCKEIACKYKSRAEWRNNDISSFQFAYKKGWLDECCVNMIVKKRINTLESIKEIASKFKTKTEWRKKDLKSYNTAKNRGWLEECSINMIEKTTLTLESCKEIASKYKTISEWLKNDSYSLNFAYKKGWIDECSINMIGFKKHTLQSCKESASKYKTRTEWQKNDKSSYEIARKKGWMDECCVNMKAILRKYTLESCKEIASKYKTRNEWIKGDVKSYQSAQRKGWLDECCVNMNTLFIKHTFESCKEIASKYKTKVEWLKNDGNSYQYAWKNGFLDECCTNMKDINRKHTLESCKEIASKYKTRIEWSKADGGSYRSAYNNGWLDECCINMKSLFTRHTFESCKESASKYKTRTEWYKYDKKSFQSARHNGWLDECMPKIKKP
jgi:superfamily II DNA or RNA helicase